MIRLFSNILRVASIRALALMACLIPTMVEGQGTVQMTVNGTFDLNNGTGHSTISPGNSFSYVLVFDDSNTSGSENLVVYSILSAQLYVNGNLHPSLMPSQLNLDPDLSSDSFGASVQGGGAYAQNAVSFVLGPLSYPSPVGSIAEFSDFYFFHGTTGPLAYLQISNDSGGVNAVQGSISSAAVVAVPEPSTWVVGGLSLLAFATIRKRRHNQS